MIVFRISLRGNRYFAAGNDDTVRFNAWADASMDEAIFLARGKVADFLPGFERWLARNSR